MFFTSSFLRWALLTTCAGCEDVGCGRGNVRDAVVTVPVVTRLQLVLREPALYESLVLAVLSSGRLCQQRRQSDPLQRHVSQVPVRVPCPARLLLLP